jgi:hypothetical protein
MTSFQIFLTEAQSNVPLMYCANPILFIISKILRTFYFLLVNKLKKISYFILYLKIKYVNTIMKKQMQL